MSGEDLVRKSLTAAATCILGTVLIFCQICSPVGHYLWRLSFVTCLCSFQFEAVEQFVQNLQRYVKGEELFNVVDKTRGY